MKLRKTDIDSFIGAPPAKTLGALVHGPDTGQAREIADRLARAITPDPSDPFAVADLTPEGLKDQPGRLGDELSTLPLMGGRKLVRLRGATDGITDAVKHAVERGHSGGFLLIEAGQLDARSKLRALFEGEDALACMACYPEDPRDIARLAREVLGADDIHLEADAEAYLAEVLGSDRQATRSELEKLRAYAGPGGRLDLEATRRVVGDPGISDIDGLADHVGLGEVEEVVKGLSRLWTQGIDATQLLRGVLRHFQRLHTVVVSVEAGKPIETVIRGLRPPLFFARATAFRRQATIWRVATLEQALRRLADSELSTKTTGMPPQSVAAQCLIGLAASARGGGVNRASSGSRPRR